MALVMEMSASIRFLLSLCPFLCVKVSVLEIVFSFTGLCDDGSQHVNMVHCLLLVCCAALLSTGLNIVMFFTWPADPLLLVWLPVLQLPCARCNSSRKIISNKQKQH